MGPMNNIEFIKAFYGVGFHQPANYSRSKELLAITEYAKRFGFEISEIDFDIAIAERFGDGVEYEWLRD